MSNLTKAGKRLQRDAIAKALCGGSYVVFDGDGNVLGKATFPANWEPDGDTAFVFKGLSDGHIDRRGFATSFAAIPPGGDEPLIGGTIGAALGKGIDVAMTDKERQLYEGMDLDVELFRHETQFDL